MGGASGEVSGKTKEETWKAFLEDEERAHDMGLVTDFPTDQSDAFEKMEWDDTAQVYVLKYHFGK